MGDQESWDAGYEEFLRAVRRDTWDELASFTWHGLCGLDGEGNRWEEPQWESQSTTSS